MIDNTSNLKVYSKENKEKEKWVIYYIYAKIKGELKAIYIGITSQLSYIKLAYNQYIINEYRCMRFNKHKRDLMNNTHDNYFLQELFSRGVEFTYKICLDKIYKSKRDAKRVENIIINNQNDTSYLCNISGLSLIQLENKKKFFNDIVLTSL